VGATLEGDSWRMPPLFNWEFAEVANDGEEFEERLGRTE
jgi:hypothetical protein